MFKVMNLNETAQGIVLYLNSQDEGMSMFEVKQRKVN